MTTRHNKKRNVGIIYELLVQWRDLGEKEVAVSWLRDTLQLEKKYTAMNNFKARVLEPAIKDINKNSDLWVEYSQRKTGRKVTHLKFKFELKEEPEKTKPKKSDPRIRGVKKSVIDKRARGRETYEEAAERIKREDRLKKYSELA